MKEVVSNLSNRAEFKTFINKCKNKYVIVKASATWCGPCKRAAPFVRDMFIKLPDGVSMVEVDLDAHEDLATYLRIRKVPTLISYVKGERTDEFQSSRPEDISIFFDKVRTHMLF